ncbi:MAG: hypothetical protein ACR2JW_15240 [Thermomicrobiales bacterium]
MTAPMIVLLGNDSAALAMLHTLSATASYRTLRCRPQEVTDAHAVVKRAEADLVILDLWASRHEDGWAFLRHLWADLDTTHIPAIVITAEEDVLPMAVDVLRMLHCHVLRKPLDDRGLLRTIATAPGLPPATDARRRSPPVAVFRAAQTDDSLRATGGA